MGYDWHSQVALLGVCEFSEFCACKGVLPCKSDFVKSAPKFNNSCSNGVLNDRDPAVRSEINRAHTHNLSMVSKLKNSTKASLRLGMNDSDMIRYVWFTVHAQCDAEISQKLLPITPSYFISLGPILQTHKLCYHRGSSAARRSRSGLLDKVHVA